MVKFNQEDSISSQKGWQRKARSAVVLWVDGLEAHSPTPPKRIILIVKSLIGGDCPEKICLRKGLQQDFGRFSASILCMDLHLKYAAHTFGSMKTTFVHNNWWWHRAKTL